MLHYQDEADAPTETTYYQHELDQVRFPIDGQCVVQVDMFMIMAANQEGGD